MPADFHNRGSVEFLTSATYAQQAQASMQPQPIPGQEPLPFLPKLNFSAAATQQPSGAYINNPPTTPKFRPPSPLTSSHHQQPSPYAAVPQVAEYTQRHAPAHFFHHYHPQMSTLTPTHTTTQAFKPQFTGPQTPTQQPLHTTPTPLPQQATTPVVLRWVMEYEKPAKK